MLTAPTPPPTPDPTSTLFSRPDVGAAATSSIDVQFLSTFIAGVVMACMVLYGISLILKPSKTSLADAGKSSGVMGIGMFWIAGALFVGAASILGLFGGFFDGLIH